MRPREWECLARFRMGWEVTCSKSLSSEGAEPGPLRGSATGGPMLVLCKAAAARVAPWSLPPTPLAAPLTAVSASRPGCKGDFPNSMASAASAGRPLEEASYEVRLLEPPPVDACHHPPRRSQGSEQLLQKAPRYARKLSCLLGSNFRRWQQHDDRTVYTR